MPRDGKIRIAAVGDLHCRLDKQGNYRRLVEGVNDLDCDVLILPGDLTDHGHIDEARLLADVLSDVRPPVVGVLGNHDHEGGNAEAIQEILGEAGVRILDGDHWEMKGHVVGFAGAKGFCGGFDRATLQGFGEPCIKAFVQESVQEALKLETALLRVDAPVKIAITHYSPVRATVAGEHPEIVPYLGSSRLAEALDKQGAAMCFHGHAHYGHHEGVTRGGVPVYNVALPLLRRADPDRRFFLVEVPIPPGAGRPAGGGHPAMTPEDVPPAPAAD